MKKIFILGVLALSGAFLSCGNSAKAESGDAKASDQIAQATQQQPAEPYKIVDGRIIPTNGKPMIIDFSATWCPPCRQLKPIFEDLEKEFSDRINFLTVDVDQYPELSQKYNVQSIPNIIFLDKDGQIQNNIVGFQNRDQLLQAINTYYGF